MSLLFSKTSKTLLSTTLAAGIVGAGIVGAGLFGGAVAGAQETGTGLVPVTEQGYSLDSPEIARLYGPGVFTMTNLANTRMTISEGTQYVASNRFRATHSGDLSTLRLYWPVGQGYSAGNGGKIKITLLDDDGSNQHLPNLSAEPIAVTYYEPKLNNNAKPENSQDLMRALQLGKTSRPLEAGKLYHVVFENIDPDPERNYSSTDNGATHKDNGKLARWLNTTDWSTLMGTRKAGDTSAPFNWTNLTTDGSGEKTFVPIMELGYADGTIQGSFDMESGSVYPKRTRIITKNDPVRERFTPSETRTISGVSVAASTETGGTLAWAIKDGDQVLSSGEFQQSEPNFTTHPMNGNDIASFTWYDAELPKHVAFEPGKTYDVEFTAVGDSTWVIGDHSNGSNYQAVYPAAFTESQAQHQSNGKWINTNHWDHNKNGNGTNWPVVLHQAP